MSATVPAPHREPAVGAPPDDPREAAIARLRRQRKLAEDALGYVAVNGVLWLIWALTGHDTSGLPWPAYVSLIWGFLLLIDAWRAYGSWPRRLGRAITDEEIEREIARSARR